MDVCGVVHTVYMYIPATTATAEVVYSTPDSLAQQFFSFDFIKIHSNDTLIYLRIIFVIAAAGNSLKAFKQ